MDKLQILKFNFCYGTHNVITTDSNGFFTTNTLFIENPDTLKLSSVIIDSSCYQIWMVKLKSL